MSGQVLAQNEDKFEMLLKCLFVFLPLVQNNKKQILLSINMSTFCTALLFEQFMSKTPLSLTVSRFLLHHAFVWLKMFSLMRLVKSFSHQMKAFVWPLLRLTVTNFLQPSVFMVKMIWILSCFLTPLHLTLFGVCTLLARSLPKPQVLQPIPDHPWSFLPHQI